MLTNCTRGHPFNPDNTYRSPGGKRHCRECRRINQARFRERARQARRIVETLGLTV